MRAATATLGYPGYAAFVRTETAPRPTEMPVAVKRLAAVCAAPVVALAFVLAFPLVGLAALAWFATRALLEHRGRVARFARNVVLFAAAPFVGLAYALAFPFVGLVLLGWMAVRKEAVAG